MSSSVIQTGARAILAILFLTVAWWAAGESLKLAFLGESSQATVVGYWDRSPFFTKFRKADPITEPVVKVAGDRAKANCKTVYRGLRRQRELPGRGQKIVVRYRKETFERCVAEVTAFSPLRLALGIGGALFGLWLALAAADEWAP